MILIFFDIPPVNKTDRLFFYGKIVLVFVFNAKSLNCKQFLNNKIAAFL